MLLNRADGFRFKTPCTCTSQEIHSVSAEKTHDGECFLLFWQKDCCKPKVYSLNEESDSENKKDLRENFNEIFLELHPSERLDPEGKKMVQKLIAIKRKENRSAFEMPLSLFQKFKHIILPCMTHQGGNPLTYENDVIFKLDNEDRARIGFLYPMKETEPEKVRENWPKATKVSYIRSTKLRIFSLEVKFPDQNVCEYICAIKEGEDHSVDRFSPENFFGENQKDGQKYVTACNEWIRKLGGKNEQKIVWNKNNYEEESSETCHEESQFDPENPRKVTPIESYGIRVNFCSRKKRKIGIRVSNY
eukprot:GHVP01003310.1.p1 GENE.GHVP01003310.1~~GHVP01003310.1.p1  ORF type:complete len:304 (-),score=55.06 GHVP01003310.1:701-1612(-)